jgi:hypothetical protein
MNMEIVRSRSGFRNKVPGGFIEVHGFRMQKNRKYIEIYILRRSQW